MNKKELFLNYIFPPRCPYCNEVIPTRDVFCPSCYKEHLFDDINHICLLKYDEQTKKIAINMKTYWDSVEVNFLARQLAYKIHSKYSKSYFYAIGYVPSVKINNQGRDIAEIISMELNVPIVNALKCNNDNKQHLLSLDERQKNVLIKFSKKENVSLSGNVLLLDDIITTGSTINRCKDLLIEEGANQVITASIFRTKLEEKKNA